MWPLFLWAENYANAVDSWCSPSSSSKTAINNGANTAPATKPKTEIDHFATAIDCLNTHSNQTLCFADSQGNVHWCMQNWQEVIGIEHDACLNDLFLERLHQQYRPAFLEKILAVSAGKHPKGARVRLQIGTRKDDLTWFECFIVSRPQTEGEVAILLQNIDREVKAERALKTAHIESELTVRGRYEFLSHMSHELRTPLNAILGFSEMMEHGVYGPVEQDIYRDYLVNIRESGHLLLNRISDMIEIVGIEVGDHSLQETEIMPWELLESAKKLHHYEAFCRNVTVITNDFCPRVTLQADRAKLIRAIGNLISNAIRFSRADGQIEVSAETGVNGEIFIRVLDEGEGINSSHLKMIHNSLKQRNNLFSTASEAVGVGLGLAVAKEFICLHDGDLHLESTKGKGTLASIILPKERVFNKSLAKHKNTADKNNAHIRKASPSCKV